MHRQHHYHKIKKLLVHVTCRLSEEEMNMLQGDLNPIRQHPTLRCSLFCCLRKQLLASSATTSISGEAVEICELCACFSTESKLLICSEKIMLESRVCSPWSLLCPWAGKGPVLSLAHTTLLCNAQKSRGGAAESRSAFKTMSASRFIDSSTLLPSHQETCCAALLFLCFPARH